MSTTYYATYCEDCIADVDSSGDLIRSYTYGPGIDNPLAMTVYGAETNTYYYLTDHLGSVLALTDEDGQPVESYEYDAFGRIKAFDSDFEEIPESAYGNRLTFQGREYSWKTGLYYFRARWYEPVTGRWLSKDPIGISGGLNQYVAFGGNGINYVDPDGLAEQRGKQRKQVTGIPSNATAKEIEKALREARSQPNVNKKHVRQLEGLLKQKKAPAKYRNKFGRGGRMRGMLLLWAVTLPVDILETLEYLDRAEQCGNTWMEQYERELPQYPILYTPFGPMRNEFYRPGYKPGDHDA